jgi:hypothetical protein
MVNCGQGSGCAAPISHKIRPDLETYHAMISIAKNSSPDSRRSLTEITTHLHERLRACDSQVKLELLGLLISGPKDVGTLARATGLDLPTVSKGLSGLRDNRIVQCMPRENRRIYSLSPYIHVLQNKSLSEVHIAINGGGQIKICLPTAVLRSPWDEMPS